MRKKTVFLIVLPLLAMLSPQFLTVRANPGVIYVPENYRTIQEAVYKAIPGDTIIVRAGTYYENVVVNQSNIVLMGENNATTIIDGRGIDNVVTLTNSSITISGFTLRNGKSFSGVETTTLGNHTIFGNKLLNNAFGINLLLASGNTVVGNTLIQNSLVGINVISSSNNTVSTNYVSQSTYGIKLEASNNNSVVGNMVSDTSYGIYLSSSNLNSVDKNNVSGRLVGIYSVYSNDVNIRENIASGGGYGIQLYGCTRNNILRNTAIDNSYGIYLVRSNTNVFDSNLASNNDWGIQFYDSDSNTVTYNTASYNAYGIYLVVTSTGNSIYKNNFLGNMMQVFQYGDSPNTWFVKISGKNYGNHWSDYLGQDTNGDGVGDDPPESLPHWSVDNYPLMNPTMTVHDVAIISVEPSATTVYAGQTVNITVIARNEGTVNETFTVTAKYFNRIIGTKTITNLARCESTTLVFNWDTTGVPTGFNYEIRAEASIVVGETDKLDNIFIDGTIEVKERLVGDINGDGTININDLVLLNQAYGSTSASGSNWNPNADLNKDNIIGALDLYLLGKNYGKSV